MGCENSTAHESPIQSWNLMRPSVVSASKSGAVSRSAKPSRSSSFVRPLPTYTSAEGRLSIPRSALYSAACGFRGSGDFRRRCSRGRQGECGSGREQSSTQVRSPTFAAAAWGPVGSRSAGPAGSASSGSSSTSSSPLLSGGGGGLGPLAAARRAAGRPRRHAVARSRASARRAQDANERQDCRIVAVVNSVAEVLGRRLQAQRQAVPLRRHRLLHRPGADRLRLRRRAQVGPVLLPARQARLHRPRLLRRAPVAVRRRGGAVRRRRT